MSDTTMPIDTTDQNDAASAKEDAARTIVVIDGNSRLHASTFHAIRQPMAALRWNANRSVSWLLQHVYQAC